MNFSRYILVIITLFLVSLEGWGQGDLLLGQYQELLSYYNPATITLSKEYTIRFTHNRQNEGLDSSSKSFVLMGEMPLRFLGKSHSLGLQMSNETMGVFTDNALAFRYAHSYKLWGDYLSVGLQLMMHNTSFEGNRLTKLTHADSLLLEGEALPLYKVNGKSIDLQLGLFFRSQRMSIGLGARHLNTPLLLQDRRYKVWLPRNYNIYLAYDLFSPSTLWQWTPSCFSEVKESGEYRVDTSLETKYKNRYFAHLLCRWGKAWGGGLGLRLERLYLGYHFELPTASQDKRNFGTHEVVLSYRMPIQDVDRSTISKSVRLL